MVTIKVIWQNSSRPVKGSKVCIGFSSGMSEEIYTDENGEADIEDANPGRSGSIYVDGRERFAGSLPGRKTIAI